MTMKSIHLNSKRKHLNSYFRLPVAGSPAVFQTPKTHSIRINHQCAWHTVFFTLYVPCEYISIYITQCASYCHRRPNNFCLTRSKRQIRTAPNAGSLRSNRFHIAFHVFGHRWMFECLNHSFLHFIFQITEMCERMEMCWIRIKEFQVKWMKPETVSVSRNSSRRE